MRRVAVLLAALVVLAGCGDDPGTSVGQPATSAASESSSPEGNLDKGKPDKGKPDQESCSFGQRLVRYGNHYYAVRGGPVNRTNAPLARDRDYRGAIASCRA